MMRKPWIFLISLVLLLIGTSGHAGLHNVPIIIPAAQIRAAQFHPLMDYRLFRTDPDGTAVPIPFQIDQKDKYGDYILDYGAHPNTKSSNGIFSQQDELCLMGNDVGIRKIPTKWKFNKPNVLYEVAFNRRAIIPAKEVSLNQPGQQGAGGSALATVKDLEGAVYIGIYYKDQPPLAKESYVSFDIDNAQVITSRYRYLFNNKNYLVVRGVDIEEPGKKEEQIILSSAVYMRLDMKYFLTLNLGHSDIESALDAYKVGPVRVIARVNFDYKILKMKFDLGMYTEVSFFSNAVNLPAVIDNPLDGKKSLNRGSYFYYGLALVDNPKNLTPKSNMPPKGDTNFLSMTKSLPALASNNTTVGHYWASAQSQKYMLYLEFQPSSQMEKDGNTPSLYVENIDKEELLKRKSDPLPLGKSPVNVAVSFDLNNFRQGLHQVQFRVFIENVKAESILEEFKSISEWKIMAQRLASNAY